MQIKLFLSILSFSISFTLLASNQSNFPVNGKMRQRVDFWKKVYTEISTEEAFIHDTEDLNVIYKKVLLPKNRRDKIKYTKNEKNEIASLLINIAKKKFDNLSDSEQKIAQIIGTRSPSEVIEMSKRIRFQYGLKDRYYNGLIRSYKFLEYIKQTFKELGLPEELVFLPHVESSFNYEAYSKVGAAGIWQFMRSTGKIYGLKINYIIDERRDPLKATRAAARLLKDNFEKLQSWPLALTAYNHGAKSMEMAISKLDTKDINAIIENYDGRRFGFASKNFYATFMATVEISKNPEKYFESFKPPKKFIYSTIELDRPYTIKDISQALNISISTIREYNHSIRAIAYRSDIYIPKGHNLKLPANQKQLEEYKLALSKIKTNYDELDLLKTHIISSGESLFYLSKLYKVNINKLISFNQISNPSQVYPGMKIKIPTKKELADLNIEKKVFKTPSILPAKEITIAENLKLPKKDISTEHKVTKFEKQELTNSNINQEDNLSTYYLEVNTNQNLFEIIVETEETIGHYAEWSNLKAQQIRNSNNISNKSQIILGQKLIIPMDKEQLNSFKQNRAQFHLGIQEDFFNNFKIVGQINYKVQKGDSIDAILRNFSLPLWLLRTYSKNSFSNQLKIGQSINIPKIEAINEESSQIPEENIEDS